MAGIVQGIILKHLSEYCDVREDDIKLSLLSGTGKIENLMLKPESLTPFDLPVAVSKATIEHIDFEIPWASLKSSPVIARVRGVYVCVTPPPTTLSDEEKRQRLERARERLVTAFEDSRKTAYTLAKAAKAAKSGEKVEAEEEGFASRMAEIILNNLVVEVSDVHVRYECRHSEASGIAHTVLGLTLGGVKLQTTDSAGTPCFSDPTKITTCHKRLSLSDLRLYSEVGGAGAPAVELASDVAGKAQSAAWDKIMKRQVIGGSTAFYAVANTGASPASPTKSGGGGGVGSVADGLSAFELAAVQRSTIFGPVRGSARATFVQKKHIVQHKDLPRVAVDLSIENVAAAWTRDQYLCVVRAGIEMSEATHRLEKLVAPDPREDLWDEYEALYRKVVFGEATAVDEARTKELYAQMPGDSVVRCRKAVYRAAKEDIARKRVAEAERVKRVMAAREEEKAQKLKEKEKAGFFGGMFMSTAATVSRSDVEAETAKKEAEWKKLENDFGVVDEDEEAPDLSDLPENYVWLKVALSVPTVSTRMNLQEPSASQFGGRSNSTYFVAPCIAELAGTKLHYAKFNKAGSMDVQLSCRELTVTNPTASHVTLPNIVYVGSREKQQTTASSGAAPAAAASSSSVPDLLRITAQLKPIQQRVKDTTLDMDLSLVFEPLHVVADPILLARLGNFFTVPSKARLITDTIGKSAAYQSATEASKQAASSSLAQIADTMSTQQVVRVSVDAAAPVVFLPDAIDRLSDSSPMLCASLGRFALSSSPPTDEVKRRRADEITRAVAARTVASLPEEVVFDRYVATLRGIAVAQSRWGHRAEFVAESHDLETATFSKTSFFLLPPVLLQCDISTPLLPQLDEFVAPVVVRGSSEGLFLRVEHGAAEIVVAQVAAPWMGALQAVEAEGKEIAAATVAGSPGGAFNSNASFSPRSDASFSPRAADADDDDDEGFAADQFVLDVDDDGHSPTAASQAATTATAPLKHVADVKFTAKSFALELIEPGCSIYVLEATPIDLALAMTNKKTDAVFNLAAFSLYDRDRGRDCAIIPKTGLHVDFKQDVVGNAMVVGVDFLDAVQLTLGQPLVDITENALGLLAIVSKLGKTAAAIAAAAAEAPDAGAQAVAAATTLAQQQQQQQVAAIIAAAAAASADAVPGSMLVKLKAPAVAVSLLAPNYSTQQCYRMAIEQIDITYDTKTVRVEMTPAQQQQQQQQQQANGDLPVEEVGDGAVPASSAPRFFSETHQTIVAGINAISLHDGINQVDIIASHFSQVSATTTTSATEPPASPLGTSKWMQVSLKTFNSSDESVKDTTGIDCKLASINVVVFAPSVVGLVGYITAPGGIVANFIGLFHKKAQQLADITTASAVVSTTTTTTAAAPAAGAPSGIAAPPAAPSGVPGAAAAAAAAAAAVSRRQQRKLLAAQHTLQRCEAAAKRKADAATMAIQATVKSVAVALLGKADRAPIFSLALNSALVDMQMCTEFPELNHIKATAGEICLRDSRTKDTRYPELISTRQSTGGGGGDAVDFISFSKMPIRDAILRKRQSSKTDGGGATAASASTAVVEFQEEVRLHMSEMVVVYTPCIIQYIVAELQGVVAALNDAAKSKTVQSMRENAESLRTQMAVASPAPSAAPSGIAAPSGVAVAPVPAAAPVAVAAPAASAAPAAPAPAPPMKLIVEMKSLRMYAALDPTQPARVIVTPGTLSVHNEITLAELPDLAGAPSVSTSSGVYGNGNSSADATPEAPKEKITVCMTGTKVLVLDSSVMDVSNSEIKACVTRKIATSAPTAASTAAAAAVPGHLRDFDTDVELDLRNICLNLNKEQYELLLRIGGDTLTASEQLEIPVELQELQKELDGATAPPPSLVAVVDSDDEEEAAAVVAVSPAAVAEPAASPDALPSMRVRAVVHSVEVKLLQQFTFVAKDVGFTMQSTPAAVSEGLALGAAALGSNQPIDELVTSRIVVSVGDVLFACDEDGDGNLGEEETVFRIGAGTLIKMITSERRDEQATVDAEKRGDAPVWFDSSDITIRIPPLVVHARASTIRSVMSNVVEPMNRLLLKVEPPRARIRFNAEHTIQLQADTIIDPMHFLHCTSEGAAGLVHFCLDLNGHALTLHPYCFVTGLAPAAETLVLLDSNCMLEVRNGTVRAPAGYAIHSWVSFASGSKILIDAASVEVSALQWKWTSLAALVETTSSASRRTGAGAGAGGSALPSGIGAAAAAQIQARQAAQQELAAAREAMRAVQRTKRIIRSIIAITIAELRVNAHSETSHFPLQQLSLERLKISLETRSETAAVVAALAAAAGGASSSATAAAPAAAAEPRCIHRRIEILTPRMQSVADELGSNCVEIMPASLQVSLSGVDHLTIDISLPDLQVATRITRALVLLDEINQLLLVVAPPTDFSAASPTADSPSSPTKSSTKIIDVDDDSTLVSGAKHAPPAPTLTPSDNIVTAARLAPGHRFVAVQSQQSQNKALGKETQKHADPAAAAAAATASSGLATSANRKQPKNASLNVKFHMNTANVLIVGVTANSYAELQLSNVQALIDVWPTLTLGASLHVAAALYNPRPAAWEVLLDDTRLDMRISTAANENMFHVSSGPLEVYFSPDTLKALLALTGSAEADQSGSGSGGANTLSHDAAVRQHATDMAAHLSKQGKSATEISRALAADRKERQAAELGRKLCVAVKNYTDDAISIDAGSFVCSSHSVDGVYERSCAGIGGRSNDNKNAAMSTADSGGGIVSAFGASRMQVEFLSRKPTATTAAANASASAAAAASAAATGARVQINPTRDSVSWLGEHVASFKVVDDTLIKTDDSSATFVPGSLSAMSTASLAASSNSANNGFASSLSTLGVGRGNKRATLTLIPVHRRGQETLISIKSHITDADLRVCGIIDLLLPGEEVFLTTKVDLESHFVLQTIAHRLLVHGVKFSQPCDTGHDVYPLTLRSILDGQSCELTAVAESNAARCFFRVQTTNRGMVMGIPHLEISILGGLTLSSDLPWPMTLTWNCVDNMGLVNLEPYGSCEVTMLQGSSFLPLTVTVRDMNYEGRVFTSAQTHISVQQVEKEMKASGADEDTKKFQRVICKLSQSPGGTGIGDQELSLRASVTDHSVHFYTPFVLCNNTSIPLQLHVAHDPAPQRRNYRDARAFRPAGLLIDPAPGCGTLDGGKNKNDGNELFMHVSFNNLGTIAAIPLHAIGVPGVFELHAGVETSPTGSPASPASSSGGGGDVYHLCFNTFFSSTRRDTRTIVITPRWVIVNRLPFQIRIGQDCALSHGEGESWMPQHTKRIRSGEASEAYAWSIATVPNGSAGTTPLDDFAPPAGSSTSDGFEVIKEEDIAVASKPLAAFVAVVARDDDEPTTSSVASPASSSSPAAAADGLQQVARAKDRLKQWVVRGRSPAAFTIDSSSCRSICIPYLDAENNTRLIVAEADVIKQDFYVYVTLRLPQQPSVLLVNRLPMPVMVEDRRLRNSRKTVPAHAQKGVLTLAPTGVEDAERHKEAAKEKVKQAKSKKGEPAAAAAAAASSADARDSGANWVLYLAFGDEKGSAGAAFVDLFAGFTRESKESPSATKQQQQHQDGPASPLSPPHAASPTVLRPTPHVQIVLTRGAGGQRIVTVLPAPRGDFDSLGKSSATFAAADTSAPALALAAAAASAQAHGGIIELSEPPPLDFFLKAEVPRFSLSLCHNSAEIVRIGLDGIRANVRRSGFEEQLSLVVEDLCVDNMAEARPVHEVALFAFRREKAKPALLFELKKKVSLAPRFMDIENLLVDIQPLIVKVGDRLILALLQAIDAFSGSDAESAASGRDRRFFVKTPAPKELYAGAPAAAPYDFLDVEVVIDEFAFNPLALRIWLSRQSDADFLQRHFGMSGAVSMLAMNLDDVAIVLDGVMFSQRQESAAQLIHYFQSLYTDKLTTQLIGLAFQYVGSIPFLGAPVKYLHTLGKGVTRFIVDPIKDIRSPTERAAAFGMGGVAMVGGVIGGAFGVVADVSKTTANLANKAAGSGKNDASSKSMVPGTVRGLVRGIGGLVYKPWEGAANNGFKGFMAGLGHGLVGVVADPLAGVLSDVGKVTGKVADFLQDKALPDVQRARMPRGFTATGGAARPGQVLEIFEVERLANDGTGWVKDGFPPTEAGPWRDARNKEANKTQIEQSNRAGLSRLLQQKLSGHVDPRGAEGLALALSGAAGGYAEVKGGGAPPSPFVALWQADRCETNYSGWTYGKPGRLEFVPEQDRKRTIRRRRWCIALAGAETLAFNAAASADTVAIASTAVTASASRIRQHVLGSQRQQQQGGGGGGAAAGRNLFVPPHPIRKYDTLQDLFCPPGCVAWVVEAIHFERHYIIKWGAPHLPGDPPGIASRKEIALPGGDKDKVFSVLPNGFVWLTPQWIKLDTRYAFFFKEGTYDSEDKGARACRRTIYRKMMALKRGVESFQPATTTAAATATASAAGAAPAAVSK